MSHTKVQESTCDWLRVMFEFCDVTLRGGSTTSHVSRSRASIRPTCALAPHSASPRIMVRHFPGSLLSRRIRRASPSTTALFSDPLPRVAKNCLFLRSSSRDSRSYRCWAVWRARGLLRHELNADLLLTIIFLPLGFGVFLRARAACVHVAG